MASLWPWIAVATVGALHGLNPASGWPLAASWGVRANDRGQALRALLPIGLGHAVSVALVAAAVLLGMAIDRGLLQIAAGAVLLLLIAGFCVRRLRARGAGARRPASAPAPLGQAGLALWSFAMSTAHGAGLMLLPALMSVCMADAPAREITASGSLLLALAALAVHAAAMLVVTGLLAVGACLGWDAGSGWLRRLALHFR
ncbi:hypothetical protein QTH87_24615 [Variovorax sp. J22P168]|uniref:hypothetical protein n=1 Tax=Variovorax jilinensis TaxID=3053513 RepID=UPI002574DF07|nr:hypothetical protein [Variovorax sp. J22P168]MDM0015644.1 hypothetical protein [Variovorax sp. J22P168]